MRDSHENLTEVEVNNLQHFSFIHQAHHFIVKCFQIKPVLFHKSMIITSSHLLVLGFGKDFKSYSLHLPIVLQVVLLTDLDDRGDLYLCTVLKSLSQ